MRVEVSGHRFTFPNECACCGSTPDSELSVSASTSWGSRVVHTETRSWDVPYCSACIQHVRTLDGARSAARWLTFASIALGVFVGFEISPWAGVAVGILSIIVTVTIFSLRLSIARDWCAISCADVDRAVAYLGWYGTLHKFEFGSQTFACHFMAANRAKLVNLSSEARALLAGMESATQPNLSRSPRRYIS